MTSHDQRSTTIGWRTRYNGLDIIVTRRFERGWTMLAGYTYSRTQGRSDQPGQPEQRVRERRRRERRPPPQLQGERLVRSAVRRSWFAVDFRLQSGPADHAHVGDAELLGDGADQLRAAGSVTVNAEPRGSVELPEAAARSTCAPARCFRFGSDALELSWTSTT